MPRTVILTGGIGSGKSVVAAMLSERGIPVYDSDSRTKALYDSEPSLVYAIEEALGVSLRVGAD
ncbi:MAG: dephospho-CoA kinase, partial [Bacteroidales bacterium]|nr:dephospho-CoA kinase [Bacteroidales bacterium]